MSRTQNLCPQQMLRARANRETFVSSTMCSQQCVIVCQDLFGTQIRTFLNMLVLLKVVELASTYSQLKIKEGFHIEQLKPDLNKQVERVSLSLHFLFIFYFICHCITFLVNYLG